MELIKEKCMGVCHRVNLVGTLAAHNLVGYILQKLSSLMCYEKAQSTT